MSRSFRFLLALRFTLAMALAVGLIALVTVLGLRAFLDRELNASLFNVGSIQAGELRTPPPERCTSTSGTSRRRKLHPCRA